ncbi:FliG C-terminal domain-containing protein [Buchnera aphidicola]|uniref:FliG C-terminal domain-containing protein n=1 Tax=Buchnera aphidicola TaxID=9 RepID=UPI0030EBD6B5
MISKYGVKKSAILLISLKSKCFVKVLKNFSSKEKFVLFKEILKINKVSFKEILKVFLNYKKDLKKVNKIVNFNRESLKIICDKSNIKKNVKKDLKNVLLQIKIKKSICKLNRMKYKKVYKLLKHEDAKIVSMILYFLKREISYQVLLMMKKSFMDEVLLRISNFSVLKKKNFLKFGKILIELLKNLEKRKNFFKSPGHKAVSEILYLFNNDLKKKSLSKISKKDHTIFYKIQKNILNFYNIFAFKKKDIKLLIRSNTILDIYVALSNINKNLQNKILIHMNPLELIKYNSMSYKNIRFYEEDIQRARLKVVDSIKYILINKNFNSKK